MWPDTSSKVSDNHYTSLAILLSFQLVGRRLVHKNTKVLSISVSSRLALSSMLIDIDR